MELILLRHGEPDLSGDDLSDPPLTERGHRQATATAAFLRATRLDAVYVSPQRRAQQTSVPIVESRPVEAVTDERIAEFDYELGGYISPDTLQDMTRGEAIDLLERYQGEAFQSRVFAGFGDIIDNHPGQTVAVVCHGGVISAMVRDVLQATQPVGPHHASVTRIFASRSGVRSLSTFNEHHWLLDL